MKRKPKILPPCYEAKYDEKRKEWKFKKSFRFKDKDGISHHTDTTWHWEIGDCEVEAKQVQKNNGKGNKNASTEPTIETTLTAYVNALEKEAKKKTAYKNTTASSKYRNASALLSKYTPKKIGDTKINDLKSLTFANWMTYINSDTSDHISLSGVRVRAFKTVIKDYIGNYLTANVLIDREKAYLYKMAIDDVPIKKKKTGKRNNRNQITIDDLKTIKNYYIEQGLEEFKNFYWYSFYTLLFCTGMRVGEIIALQWKNVIFDKEPEYNVIKITNSIGEREDVENVMERLRQNNLEAKNKYSVRNITMWAYYCDLLRDFKHSSMCHFNYQSAKDMGDKFVFPNLAESKRPYRTQKSTLVHTNNLMNKLELPKTDNQMFRHACAYFLAYEMGCSIEDTFDYFGHCDSDMIREVYAPLNAEEKRIKVSRKLNSLITDKEAVFERQGNSKTNAMAGEELEKRAEEKRKQREIGQINRAIGKGQSVYKYPKYSEPLIDEIKKEHPSFEKMIKFKLEED
jgi:integrase